LCKSVRCHWASVQKSEIFTGDKIWRIDLKDRPLGMKPSGALLKQSRSAVVYVECRGDRALPELIENRPTRNEYRDEQGKGSSDLRVYPDLPDRFNTAQAWVLSVISSGDILARATANLLLDYFDVFL
jgi:hypothetical protein